MYTNDSISVRPGKRGELQLRLFPLRRVTVAEPWDELQLRNWGLTDVRALAMDPDVEMRRLAALTPWVIDANLQNVLAGDPDEQVVMNLLTQVDPHGEATRQILAGPHTAARRDLARRNLTTATLLTLADDIDLEVRRAARATLERRGVAPLGNAA